MAVWKEMRVLVEHIARTCEDRYGNNGSQAIRAALARLDAAERVIAETGPRGNNDKLRSAIGEYFALCHEQDGKK